MTINCKGTLVDLSTPKVMGILNVTPDSFYDGGNFQDLNSITKQVEKMVIEGADFIDVGGYSSKPGAKEVSESEELQRVIHVIASLKNTFGDDINLSIDTFRSKVAYESVQAGAALVNDISAGKLDRNMFESVGKLRVPYVGMHMQGTPQTMQLHPSYENILFELKLFFAQKKMEAFKAGIHDFIVDPGFGFGKTLYHNYEILSGLDLFESLNCPVLIGVSRKSMIQKVLNIKASAALNGTTALHSFALTKGVQLLRVHDVKEAVETCKLFNQMSASES